MSETDERLLAQARLQKAKGQYDAFEQLISKYEKLIYSIAYRYLNNPEDALDISQEVVIKLYNNLSRVAVGGESSSALKGWVCAVTVNACLDELRKRGRRKVTDLPDGWEPVHTSASPEEITAARETVNEILAAVDSLPNDFKTMIILRDMNGLRYFEIADALQISVNTVKSRLSRARAALHNILTVQKQ